MFTFVFYLLLTVSSRVSTVHGMHIKHGLVCKAFEAGVSTIASMHYSKHRRAVRVGTPYLITYINTQHRSNSILTW